MRKETTAESVGATDRQLDAWAEGFERGQWPGSKTVLLGRPRRADEELRTVTFRLPRFKVAELDAAAARHGRTRSEELREAVGKHITEP